MRIRNTVGYYTSLSCLYQWEEEKYFILLLLVEILGHFTHEFVTYGYMRLRKDFSFVGGLKTEIWFEVSCSPHPRFLCGKSLSVDCRSSFPQQLELGGCQHRPSQAGLWIRIGSGFSDFVDPYWDPGVRKLRNFSGKLHFLVIFNKNFTTKKV
jgi:hypothetical protein